MTRLHFFSIRFSSFFTGKLRFTLALFVILSACFFILPDRQVGSAVSARAQSSGRVPMPALRGEEAIEHLKAQGSYQSLAEAMAAVKYQATWQATPRLENLSAAYELKNPAHNLLAYVNGDGLQVTSLSSEKKSWRLGLRLSGIGYAANLSPVTSGEITAKDNRVEIKRDSALSPQSSVLTEWFVNSQRGIEHGFTINRRPATDDRRPASERLQLRFAVSGDLPARIDATGKGVVFSRAAEDVVLSYDKLLVTDAKGQTLNAAMRVEKEQVVIEVADATAEYPLRIDPLLTEVIKLTASDGADSDRFGQSVAISGDTVVVGAFYDDVGANLNQGSAYVFVRSGSSWTEQAKLVASDGAAGDLFGNAVAISGDTVVAGAYSDDVGANSTQGSAYVFVRSGTNWTEQAHLTTSDGAADDYFGNAVAINGDTAVVGAQWDDVGTNSGQGSAYIFVRIGTSWIKQAKLTASDGAANDIFGNSVAVSGNTVVVGARGDEVGTNDGQGSAYVFVYSGSSWIEQAKLVASDGAAGDGFGNAVAISGDTVVAGAYNDDVGANANQGSAYVFTRSGMSWTEQAHLAASDGAVGDCFGIVVAINGDIVIVGAYSDDVGANRNQGSAYVFVRSGSSWTEQAKLVASDGAADDFFGQSVAISRDMAVVGAFYDDMGTNSDQGSAYLFSVNWTEQDKLVASDGAVGDYFGSSVAISGDTVVVGASYDDVGANSDQGSAYVFTRSGTNWTEQAHLAASDGAPGDYFGIAVAISGDTVVAGAYLDDVGTNSDQGSAYVFTRSGAIWTEQAHLIDSDGAAYDYFGTSLAISGDTAVVGAQWDDVGGNYDQGSAYVFVRSGASWTEQAHLTASDGDAGDNFGISVAISGDTVVVSAWIDDTGANIDQGSAYVFVRSGASWTEQAKLTASDGAVYDNFGSSVAISGDTVVVGALHDDVGANFDQGSAYVFVRSGSSWTEQTHLTASDGDAGDNFGYSVAISGDTLVVGAFLDDLGANLDQGSAYVYFYEFNTAPIIAACNGLTRQQGSPATLSTIATVDDAQDALGDLIVTVASAPAGISVTNLINTNGMITALVAASCTAASGNNSVVLQVQDSNGAVGTAYLVINVTINDPPALGAYSDTSVGVTGSTSVIPAVAPSDNGAIISFTAASPTFEGTLSANPASGVVTITEARPGGTHLITVTAVDNCGSTTTTDFVLTVDTLLVWNGSTSSDWHTAANWTPAVVSTSYHDVLIPTAGVVHQPVVSAASSVIHSLSLEVSRTLTINSSRQLTTQGDITNAGQITGAGKLTFDGATFTQNGSVSVAFVEFDAGTHALSGGGAFASGIATILNGATVTLTSDHQMSVVVINSGGSFDLTDRTLTLTGAGTAMFNSGSCTMTGSTVVYAGSVVQVVTAYLDYHNLTINNPAGVSLADEVTVNGQLTLLTDLTTGAFTLTMPGTVTSIGTGDVIGNVKRTGFVTAGAALSFGNPLNTIQINSGSAPSEITVNLVKSPPAGFSNAVSRTYTITPTGGSGYSATLRLRYKDAEASGLNESTFELWRYTGSSWQSPTGTATRDTTANWVEETGVTQFSPWTISGPSGPTFVELISFAANVYNEGTLLEWKTGFEVDNLGFNIYREENGRRQMVNPYLVAGSALRASFSSPLESGEAYSWWDTGSKKGQNLAYWLEDIDLAGKSTWHGPFYPQAAEGAVPAYSQAALLGQLRYRQTESEPTRAVARVAEVAIRPTPQQLKQQEELASQPAVKIAIRDESWYRLSQAELVAAGLPEDADPRLLQLFVEGQEVPILVSTGKGDRFDQSSFIEFYGLGLDTPTADRRTYWLTAGDKVGKRIQSIKGEGAASTSTSFTQTVERRDREIYFAALLNGERENFFGPVVTLEPVDQTLLLRHLDTQAATEASLEIALQGVTQLPHRVLVQLNGLSLGYLDFQRQDNQAVKFTVPQALLREGINTVRLVSQNGAGDVSLVDTIRLSYPHTFNADSDSLKFTLNSKEQVTVGGFTSKAIRVFDVTDTNSPQELLGKIDGSPDSGYAITVATNKPGKRNLLALTDGQAQLPASIKANRESNLKAAPVATFLIITKREFIAELEPLRALREREGLRTLVVDVEDIYDEFNFGNKSAQAIKDFLQLVKPAWQTEVRFVLFASDATYDEKNYLGLGELDGVVTKLVDTSYLETASDDWFSDFNNDGIGEMATGRLPIRSLEEARTIVAKILAYEGSNAAHSALLVADKNEGFNFEQASAGLRDLLPREVKAQELNRGSLDADTAKARLIDLLNQGQKLVNYVGHGSVNAWNGGLLTADEGRSLSNRSMPLFVMMNCLNGYFQDAVNESLSESLIRAERGGAIAVWSSTGLSLPEEQEQLNREFYRLLFNAGTVSKGDLTLGEAMQRAKAVVRSRDIRQTWILLGDPAMRLK